MKEVIEKAINSGLKEICFTDHMDYDFAPAFNRSLRFEFDPEIYLPTLEKYKKEYKSDIRILSGIELGLQPHMIKESNDVINSYEFDFVLGSVHNVSKLDLTGKEVLDFANEELWTRYFEEMLFCIENIDRINSIGHFDVPKRYHEKFARFEITNSHKEKIIEIFKLMIEKEIALEINTAGFKYGLNDNNPSIDFIDIYVELGGQLFTIGSDSHNVNQVGKGIEEGLKMLQLQGVQYISTFKNQELIQKKIDKFI
jgi:histidinol-phosphatase (PHP family)